MLQPQSNETQAVKRAPTARVAQEHAPEPAPAATSTPPPRPPGPRGLPIIGSALPALRDPLSFLKKAHAEHGDVVRFRFGHLDYHMVSDPEAIRHVLVDNAKNYTKSRNYDGLKLVLGRGLLTSEGDEWRKQRKLAQPAFHRDRLAGLASRMSEATGDMLARWRAEDDGAGAFCAHEEMMRLTFRIVGLTLLSTDVDGDAREVGDALGVAMHFANDYVESLVPIPTWLPTPDNFRFRKAMKTLDRVVYRIIQERRVSGTEHGDLLDMLMSAREEGTDRAMSDVQLRDELLTLVLAGHETTANLLSFTFMMLSRHPDVARRLHDEAVSVLGGGDGRPATLEDVPRLSYAKMVLEEVLRLYPPAWSFERQATAPDVIGGYAVDRGAIVAVCPYVLHRHPLYWDNPEGFDPERFTPERSAGRPRYAYVPFGAGPRTCIGNHFAMMEAQIILAMVAREYRLDLVSAHDVVLDPVITLRPKTGIKVERRRWGCPAPRTPSGSRSAARAAAPRSD